MIKKKDDIRIYKFRYKEMIITYKLVSDLSNLESYIYFSRLYYLGRKNNKKVHQKSILTKNQIFFLLKSSIQNIKDLKKNKENFLISNIVFENYDVLMKIYGYLYMFKDFDETKNTIENVNREYDGYIKLIKSHLYQDFLKKVINWDIKKFNENLILNQLLYIAFIIYFLFTLLFLFLFIYQIMINEKSMQKILEINNNKLKNIINSKIEFCLEKFVNVINQKEKLEIIKNFIKIFNYKTKENQQKKKFKINKKYKVFPIILIIILKIVMFIFWTLNYNDMDNASNYYLNFVKLENKNPFIYQRNVIDLLEFLAKEVYHDNPIYINSKDYNLIKDNIYSMVDKSFKHKIYYKSTTKYFKKINNIFNEDICEDSQNFKEMSEEVCRNIKSNQDYLTSSKEIFILTFKNNFFNILDHLDKFSDDQSFYEYENKESYKCLLYPLITNLKGITLLAIFVNKKFDNEIFNTFETYLDYLMNYLYIFVFFFFCITIIFIIVKYFIVKYILYEYMYILFFIELLPRNLYEIDEKLFNYL